MLGETIGNFRVSKRVGDGGMGEVYLAEQTSIGTQVAIKVLRPEISVERQHVDRFFNEARAVSRIRHAGTVKIFDVGFHNGSAYLVMEFLEGETLTARIYRGGGLPLTQISDIGRQAAGVLEATHAAGITHRDLKPDNIFLCPDAELASGERVKILDFGIAKLTGTTAAGGPRTVGTMGTPAYMAPEQWGDTAKVDWRADVYSLGCVLMEMATGKPPFITDTFAQACGAHLSQPPPKLRTRSAGLPEQLETLIDGMLAKSPNDRPQLREVAKVLEQLPTLTSAPSAPTVLAPQPLAPPVAPTIAASPATHEPVVFSPTPAFDPTLHHPPQTTRIQTPAQAVPATKTSKARLYAIAAAVALGGGIAAVVAASSGNETKGVETPSSDPPAPSADGREVTADASVPSTPDAPPVPRWEEPAFSEIAGLKVMTLQATRAHYRGYLATLPPASQTKATPLKEWSADRADEPVGWVTFEQARAFCQAIGGDLLAKDQWMRVAKGSWHIGPAPVVFRDWTSTVTSDGLAVVLGGTSKMASDADRMAAVENPLSKPTEASAGASPSPETIASATIGIRCVRP